LAVLAVAVIVSMTLLDRRRKEVRD
ncbi:MAG: hypothetical protein QOJ97_1997, partial [Solirubrobacteraceae bacterium]|nr:hypothetical protein [Solirubrobacteraceae bacterium]